MQRREPRVVRRGQGRAQRHQHLHRLREPVDMETCGLGTIRHITRWIEAIETKNTYNTRRLGARRVQLKLRWDEPREVFNRTPWARTAKKKRIVILGFGTW